MFLNKAIMAVVIAAICTVGCASTTDPVTIADEARANTGESSPTRWEWGKWMFHVDETHDNIEAVPVRETAWHLNVLKFVEQYPCSSCLKIGKPTPQGDGSIKAKVMLSHPFPGVPRYTGFDVRGTVVFPATRYWTTNVALYNGKDFDNWWLCWPPFNFSWPGDGGAGLLNADGYSYYFWPGFDLGEGYEMPIFHYQEGKYSTGGALDSTVNPYITFDNGSERRMFETHDVIQRTYHIQLPQGEFSFGYAVEASWTPPDNVPVINPALDFPPSANTEDPIILSFEQLVPLNPYEVENEPTGEEEPFAKCSYIINTALKKDVSGVHIIAPEMRYWGSDPDIWQPVAHNESQPLEISEGVYEAYIYEELPTAFAPPYPPTPYYIDGSYLALLWVGAIWDYEEPIVTATLFTTISFRIVEIELVSYEE